MATTLSAAEQAMRASVGDVVRAASSPAGIQAEIARTTRDLGIPGYLSGADRATATQYIKDLRASAGLVAGETAGVPADVYTDAMGNSIGGASTDGTANHADTTKTTSGGLASFFGDYISSAGLVVLGLLAVGAALFMSGNKQVVQVVKSVTKAGA